MAMMEMQDLHYFAAIHREPMQSAANDAETFSGAGGAFEDTHEAVV